jgi:hypothetical protein
LNESTNVPIRTSASERIDAEKMLVNAMLKLAALLGRPRSSERNSLHVSIASFNDEEDGWSQQADGD